MSRVIILHCVWRIIFELNSVDPKRYSLPFHVIYHIAFTLRLVKNVRSQISVYGKSSAIPKLQERLAEDILTLRAEEGELSGNYHIRPTVLLFGY
jgi:hypothetical protein